MQIFPIKTPLIKPEDNLVDLIIKSMFKQGYTLKDGDLIAVSSKVVSITSGRVVNLKNILPSEKATELAQKYSLEPEFVELILIEAEKIYGGVKKAILTLKDGMLNVNAGIDHKNAPKNHAILPPQNPELEAEKIRREIYERTGKNVGVIIVDSQVSPLKMGTRGIALAIAGFKPLTDYRGKKDLYGKEIHITLHSLADDLASAAHLLMGESDEKVPIVLIRNAPITLTSQNESEKLKISTKECVYANAFQINPK